MTTTAPAAAPATADRRHAILELDAVRVGYPDASGEVRVLVEGLDLALAPGDMVGLWGRSGTGKSSLIRHIAGLTRPLAGAVRYRSPDGDLGGEVGEFGASELACYRREHLGYVDQGSVLIGELSALDNATVWVHGGRRSGARSTPAQAAQRARELLERLGLGHRLGAPAARLSGGEAQRVALVRALSKGPRLIVADEPTGHLDGATAREAIAVLREHAAAGAAVLLSSHDPLVHAAVDRAVRVGED